MSIKAWLPPASVATNTHIRAPAATRQHHTPQRGPFAHSALGFDDRHGAVEEPVDAAGQGPRLPRGHAMVVRRPATHLGPGAVDAECGPVPGLVGLGRYPHGVDAMSEAVAAARRDATFSSQARPDIMRWKYRKLLLNLANAVEAVPRARRRPGGLGALGEGERGISRGQRQRRTRVPRPRGDTLTRRTERTGARNPGRGPSRQSGRTACCASDGSDRLRYN